MFVSIFVFYIYYCYVFKIFYNLQISEGWSLYNIKYQYTSNNFRYSEIKMVPGLPGLPYKNLFQGQKRNLLVSTYSFTSQLALVRNCVIFFSHIMQTINFDLVEVSVLIFSEYCYKDTKKWLLFLYYETLEFHQHTS